jgi:hypothetical protein
MRGARVLLSCLGLLVLLNCCAPASPSPAPTSTSPSTLGQHLVVELEGKLGYKRPGWKEYVPLSFGTALSRGDLLQAEPNSEGVIVCADLSVTSLAAGYLGGLPCPEDLPILTRGESLVVAPRRDLATPSAVPYLLSPRRTFIRTGSPLIRWAATDAGTTSYAVRLWGGDLEWETTTETTEVRYPKDAPPLRPGTAYQITVTDSSGRSSDSERATMDLSFALLAPEETAQIEALVAQVQGLGLGERATRLLEAEVYAAHQLRADAIAILEDLSVEGNVPSVHQRLGGLYLEMGLYTEAEAAYEEALAGYRSMGDRAGEASALMGMGIARQGDRDESTARDNLAQARDLYSSLGDVEGAGRANEALAVLGDK